MRNKILIIDDHKEFRKILRSFIENQIKDIDIKEAASGEEGIEMAVLENPQVALIDLQLAKMDGIQTALQIKRLVPACYIIAMSMFVTHKWKYLIHKVVDYIDKNEIDTKLIPILKKRQ
jgi:DNA-binding NarL/FixJ family response regulator